MGALNWRIGKMVFLQRNYLQSRLKGSLFYLKKILFVTGNFRNLNDKAFRLWMTFIKSVIKFAVNKDSKMEVIYLKENCLSSF